MRGDDRRSVWAEIDLGALRDNVHAFRSAVAPAVLCAVVKADAYGHGAVPASRAVLEAGARVLAVANVDEGEELRAAGIDAPIMVLSQPRPEDASAVAELGLEPVVYTAEGIDALAAAVGPHPVGVHLKVDTGMHRVGCPPDRATDLARRIETAPGLVLAGVCTHFAVADHPGHDFTVAQQTRFAAVLAGLADVGIAPGTIHACNSAAAFTASAAHSDMVRIGIGLYGVVPGLPEPGVELRPVMAVKARVAHAQQLGPGEGVSYGLRYTTERSTRIVTVPIGYADGVPRGLGMRGGVVLVRGRRRPIAGTVTMDQLMVDVGDDPVEPGEEVVLVGEQGGERIGVEEWARLMDTIPNEIVCGIGPRVPRRYP
ncbi:MAG: alanine racemase [Actinomycetota bacterium]